MVNYLVYKCIWKSLSSHVALSCETNAKKDLNYAQNAFEIRNESSHHNNNNNLKQVADVYVQVLNIHVVSMSVCVNVPLYVTTLSLWKWNLHIQTLTLFFWGRQKRNKWCCAAKKETKGKSTPIRIKTDKKCDRKIMLSLCTRRVKYICSSWN